MEYKIGDNYNFPTSEGYETSFEGSISRITDKAIEFNSGSKRCVNHGHSACNISEVCWLPKSIIEKNYVKYDDMFGTHYVMPPFWMSIKPRNKHDFHFTKESE